MLTKEHVIEKVRILPKSILKEVDDFIDFLEIKTKKVGNEWNWLARRLDKIEESDFKDYLDGLTSYEDMLARGEIRWK
ncbi:MAG: hypothetical protein AB1414_10395 [bacterium]